MEKLTCQQAAEISGLRQNEISNFLHISKNASKLGAEILMNYFGDISSIASKGRKGDLVTNADIESEKEIIKYLQKNSPEIGIFAEEGGAQGHKGSLVWCIDPLDGTTNYAHGYPFFATSIGLTYKDMPILGSISIPFLKEHYWAAPGIGSFCNGRKLNVSSSQKLIDSLLVTGFAYDRFTEQDNNYSEFCWLTHRTRGVRRGGAAAVDMAFVAAGRVDGYWERGLSKWDLAAGVPLVELAGGSVSDYKGELFNLSSGRILACNPYIKNELKSELDKIVPLKEDIYGA